MKNYCRDSNLKSVNVSILCKCALFGCLPRRDCLACRGCTKRQRGVGVDVEEESLVLTVSTVVFSFTSEFCGSLVSTWGKSIVDFNHAPCSDMVIEKTTEIENVAVNNMSKI